MKKLKVKLERCHGVKKLETDFDFSKFKTYLIYAPNGTMKTSLAKTFKDYIQNQDSKDQVFDSSNYQRQILDENGQEIEKDNIFVINSYIDTNYTSENISTLLVRNELREKYAKILNILSEYKKELIKKLKINTSSSDCEQELINAFNDLGNNFYQILKILFSQISKQTFKEYNFKYNDIFDNEAVTKFIKKNKEQLQQYYNIYFEILKNSNDFFSIDSSFGTAEAAKLSEALSDNKFFQAGHHIKLKDSTIINTSQDFQDLINQKIQNIIKNPQLQKEFNKIDIELRPKNLQSLKQIIEKDQSIILELLNLEEFKKNYWKSHLSQINEDVKNLLSLYDDNKPDIDNIIEEAKKQSPKWVETIDIFQKRFRNLPFEIKVKNTIDSVLGIEKPELDIQYIDQITGDTQIISKENLTENILSQGEKRAFYLLNIIFEIRARLIKNQETLFIIDDIADSFDYKNKYAITEYLKDLSKEPNFYSIILTHNFDFFRTIQTRILTNQYQRSHSFSAEKTNTEIKLISAGHKNTTNPFAEWRQEVNNSEKHLIACIPFVRNLIDFQEDQSKDSQLLTNLLHYIKQPNQKVKKTLDITIADLEAIYQKYLKNIDFQFPDKNKKVIEIIQEQIDAINISCDDGNLLLAEKIILALGIRLKAEEYIWSKIKNQQPINKNQTGQLFERYKKEFKDNQSHQKAIQTLESVMVMTPESIHLNAFMYEPIIDLGIDELKNLYQDVLKLFDI